MNLYRINYTTKALEEGGETGCTNITELTEVAARKAFKERYRQEGYTVTGIELISENAQASKEQERRALAQIVDIVRNLGPDSYLATSFKGCFEIAESNIDCDFADNFFDRAEIAAGRASDYEDECVELKAQLEKVREEAGNTTDTMKKFQKQLEYAHSQCDDYIRCENEAQQRAESAEGDLHFARVEIMELKARLYDYMITAS